MGARNNLRAGSCALLSLLAVPALASAFETARMVVPAEFAADAERIAITGFGGRNRGQYRLGSYAGSFERIETRWAVFDPLYAASRARGVFTLSGPDIDGTVSAECGMKKNTVTIGIVTFDPKKMSYQCTFERNGRVMDARFALGQPRPDGARERFLAWDRRVGIADLGDARIALRSVHDIDGTRLASPVPVGYLLEIDGAVVGAVELTDVNPTFYLAAQMPASLRENVLVASMALAVLRDPADSALGD